MKNMWDKIDEEVKNTLDPTKRPAFIKKQERRLVAVQVMSMLFLTIAIVSPFENLPWRMGILADNVFWLILFAGCSLAFGRYWNRLIQLRVEEERSKFESDLSTPIIRSL